MRIPSDRDLLGDFLRARRSRLQPADVGLPASLTLRRVPGLRRQEVADLAGLSLDYYTRIEQGRVGDVSPGVLDALATALRLEPGARDHLHALARPARSRPLPVPAPRRRPEVEMVVDGITAPAFVSDARLDVLGSNLPFRLLLSSGAGPPAPAPANLALWLFLDPAARALFASDWERVCGDVLAGLRASAAILPGDARLREVLGALQSGSGTFARLWPAAGGATPVWRSTRTVHHAVAGEFAFHQVTLHFPGESGSSLTMLMPLPGTGAGEVLEALSRRLHDGVLVSSAGG